ncbi:MAG: hypothetical protein KKB51_15895 [Candidatus Riflebacteria bacterium]|nr:hypothetical protein [Candidatus Riflebacteria bacterium]
MVQSVDSKEPKRSFIIRMLYFCLHPVILVILILAIATIFLATPFRLLIKPVELPEFVGPEQESFWSLQEKQLDMENSAGNVLSLSHSEFNAFLAGYQIPPEAGFCLQRLRCIADNASATLYIIGSGFFMRSLVFQLGMSLADSHLQIERLHVNSLELSSKNMAGKYVMQYLRDQAMKKPESFVAKILLGKGNVEFSADQFLLMNEFMPTFQRSEQEETPIVENETEEENTGSGN